jgi:hypothetical protein
MQRRQSPVDTRHPKVFSGVKLKAGLVL